MSACLSPLKFQPLLRALPWGGRRLGELLGKNLPDDKPYGESWELVDLPEAQSRVAEGPFAGLELAELLKTRKQELVGDFELSAGRFPLLFKFIDAADTLSVQVHPDEAACARLGGGARPKTEAWYVLAAEPGAELYLGLQEGVGAEELRRGLEAGTVAELLQAVKVQAGEFYYLPAGMLHAIGAGVLLAEVQQASDTTFRLFDWNRKGLDGKPRALHIEQAFASIDFSLRGQAPAAAPVSGRQGLRGPFFSFERLRLSAGGLAVIDGGRPGLVACIEGGGRVEAGGAGLALALGECCLVPAEAAGHLQAESGGAFLLIRA